MIVKTVRCALVLVMVMNFTLIAFAESVKVPVGTPVNLQLLETVSSKTAHIGQQVRFSVISDVIIEGETIIKKGAIAIGEVSEVSSAGMVGVAGKLAVTLQLVDAVDGNKIQISATKGAKGKSKLAASIALTAVCCVLAIFMKGKNVVYKEGTYYTAYVMAATEVRVD